MLAMAEPQDHSPPSPEQTPILPWELPRFRNWIALAKVNLHAKQAMTDGLASVGLDLTHYEVIAAIYRFPGLTQQQLADKLLVGRSNLSMLLPDLERRSIVERKPDASDKRLRRLTLTPQGEEQAREGLAVQVRLIEHMMGALSAEECEAVGDMMRRIGSFLRENPFRP
jgi:MarR family transcriptional regulator, organic hydroperoxide resistance regulator